MIEKIDYSQKSIIILSIPYDCKVYIPYNHKIYTLQQKNKNHQTKKQKPSTKTSVIFYTNSDFGYRKRI